METTSSTGRSAKQHSASPRSPSPSSSSSIRMFPKDDTQAPSKVYITQTTASMSSPPQTLRQLFDHYKIVPGTGIYAFFKNHSHLLPQRQNAGFLNPNQLPKLPKPSLLTTMLQGLLSGTPRLFNIAGALKKAYPNPMIEAYPPEQETAASSSPAFKGSFAETMARLVYESVILDEKEPRIEHLNVLSANALREKGRIPVHSVAKYAVADYLSTQLQIDKSIGIRFRKGKTSELRQAAAQVLLHSAKESISKDSLSHHDTAVLFLLLHEWRGNDFHKAVHTQAGEAMRTQRAETAKKDTDNNKKEAEESRNKLDELTAQRDKAIRKFQWQEKALRNFNASIWALQEELKTTHPSAPNLMSMRSLLETLRSTKDQTEKNLQDKIVKIHISQNEWYTRDIKSLDAQLETQKEIITKLKGNIKKYRSNETHDVEKLSDLEAQLKAAEKQKIELEGIKADLSKKSESNEKQKKDMKNINETIQKQDQVIEELAIKIELCPANDKEKRTALETNLKIAMQNKKNLEEEKHRKYGQLTVQDEHKGQLWDEYQKLHEKLKREEVEVKTLETKIGDADRTLEDALAEGAATQKGQEILSVIKSKFEMKENLEKRMRRQTTNVNTAYEEWEIHTFQAMSQSNVLPEPTDSEEVDDMTNYLYQITYPKSSNADAEDIQLPDDLVMKNILASVRENLAGNTDPYSMVRSSVLNDLLDILDSKLGKEDDFLLHVLDKRSAESGSELTLWNGKRAGESGFKLFPEEKAALLIKLNAEIDVARSALSSVKTGEIPLTLTADGVPSSTSGSTSGKSVDSDEFPFNRQEETKPSFNLKEEICKFQKIEESHVLKPESSSVSPLVKEVRERFQYKTTDEKKEIINKIFSDNSNNQKQRDIANAILTVFETDTAVAEYLAGKIEKAANREVTQVKKGKSYSVETLVEGLFTESRTVIAQSKQKEKEALFASISQRTNPLYAVDRVLFQKLTQHPDPKIIALLLARVYASGENGVINHLTHDDLNLLHDQVYNRLTTPDSRDISPIEVWLSDSAITANVFPRAKFVDLLRDMTKIPKRLPIVMSLLLTDAVYKFANHQEELFNIASACVQSEVQEVTKHSPNLLQQRRFQELLSGNQLGSCVANVLNHSDRKIALKLIETICSHSDTILEKTGKNHAVNNAIMSLLNIPEPKEDLENIPEPKEDLESAQRAYKIRIASMLRSPSANGFVFAHILSGDDGSETIVNEKTLSLMNALIRDMNQKKVSREFLDKTFSGNSALLSASNASYTQKPQRESLFFLAFQSDMKELEAIEKHVDSFIKILQHMHQDPQQKDRSNYGEMIKAIFINSADQYIGMIPGYIKSSQKEIEASSILSKDQKDMMLNMHDHAYSVIANDPASNKQVTIKYLELLQEKLKILKAQKETIDETEEPTTLDFRRYQKLEQELLYLTSSHDSTSENFYVWGGNAVLTTILPVRTSQGMSYEAWKEGDTMIDQMPN